MYETLVLPMCSNQSLRRVVSQGAYSSDIVSNYYELVSGVIKILTSHEMCKFSRLCFQKKDDIYGWVEYRQASNICDQAYEN